MSEPIQIIVNLNRQEYLALVRIAASKTTDTTRPVQAHHLVEHLVRRELSAPPRKKQHRGPQLNIDIDEVKRLHAEGLSDWEMANVLGCSRSAVRYRRGDILHLPSNAGVGRPRKEQP